MIAKTLTAALLAAAAATPALAQDRWDWGGGRPNDREYRLSGAGVPILYRELRVTNRGRAFVLRNFDWNKDGRVGPAEARAANRAFAGVAGPRRDRFDWARFDAPPPVAIDSGRGDGRWDRAAMRGYGFRQTDRGAMLRLEESVLFATDSATLRTGAVDKLRALADYLNAERGVRIAIEGHTDARGTDTYNQALSLRRADAVRAAFDDLGVTRARFVVAGKGESQPIAANTTAQGMQQNRRVEITLLGRRADEFAGG